MKVKKAYIGILLIGIMFFSTIAVAALQSVTNNVPQNQPQQGNVALPTSNVVDYELSPQQELQLLRGGRTILKYSYPLNCRECQQEKIFLETLATNTAFSGQLTLQEVTSSLNTRSLEIYSAYGSQKLTAVNETEVVDVLCKIAITPPVMCALRGG